MEEIKWLNWEEYLDADNNTYYQALGISRPEGRSCFRIMKKLKNNKIVFIEASDPDLCLDTRSFILEEWDNLYDAKYDMNRHYQQLIK